jgi:heme/copper-type cytochrome/quinol oxidase subunit 1
MNKYLKEIIWFLLIVTLCALLYTKEDATIDINIHDTYYVIDHFTFVLNIFISAGFVIYAIRALAGKFQNNVVNSLFIIFTILLLFVLTQVIIINEHLSMSQGWTIHPPLSAQTQQINNSEGEYLITPVYLSFIQIVIIIIALYTSYRIGKNISKKSNEK